MYYVMDAHSFYNFIYFILLIIVSTTFIFFIFDEYPHVFIEHRNRTVDCLISYIQFQFVPEAEFISLILPLYTLKEQIAVNSDNN